jgi:hypothetical protein
MERNKRKKTKRNMTVKERAQKERIKRIAAESSVIHLCDTCVSEIQECTGSPTFGSGNENDNVVFCSQYVKTDALVIASRGSEYKPRIASPEIIDNEAKAARLIEDRNEEDYHERRLREKQGGV